MKSVQIIDHGGGKVDVRVGKPGMPANELLNLVLQTYVELGESILKRHDKECDDPECHVVPKTKAIITAINYELARHRQEFHKPKP